MITYKIVSKPKILLREDTAIILSWDDVFSIENLESSTINYKLQVDVKFEGWKTVYCGPKTVKKVHDLGVCTLYKFRLGFFTKNYNSEWLNFRAGTDCGPYLVMHMTRALKTANTSMIRKLAQLRPVLLEVENKELKTPLIQLIEANDLEMVKFLLNMGANVNSSTLSNKRTPLMIALYKGYTKIASFLLDKGANLHAIDVNLMTPLHYAVDSNILRSVEFGVQNGSNVNSKDNQGWTPLMRAVILNADIKIVDYLLKHGADVNLKDNNGFNFIKHCGLSNEEYLQCLRKSRGAHRNKSDLYAI